MADYNLGRARGTIDIDYDGGGARRAQADMSQTAAEAAALDAAMGRVNDQFDRNHEVTVTSAEDIIRARGEVDKLRRSYQEMQKEYERAEKAVTEAERHRLEVLQDHSDDLEAVRNSQLQLTRAEQEADRVRQRAADSYEEYQTKMRAVREEVDRFNASHASAANGFRNMGREAERFGNVLEGLEEKLSGVARILGQIGIFGLMGGAAGGQLFATMAGGMHLLVTAMAAVIEVANAFVGAIALIPAVVNAAVLGLGTLVLAFQGVGGAISSMGDPKKFVEAIKDLSPAAKQAMLTLQSFTEAFRGVRYAVQESLFAPIVAEIQPLVMQWLPMLQNAMVQIGGEFGQAFKQIFQYFKTSEAQSSFQTFTQNMIAGFQAARGAIQPFLEAWNKLAEVGSGLFPRLGSAITDVANKFNAWIQRTSASGQLAEYLNKALDAFTNMGRIIRDVAFGLNNMFGVFESQSGSALENIANMAAKFREWTESMSGQNAIFSFFSLIKTAAEAVRPALSLLGDSLAIIGRTMTELGIAVQPGIQSFFQSFKESLAGLAPYILQAAPAINQFLAAFGQTMQQVVGALGPQLPELLQDLSDAFVSIMKVIPPVVDVFADFLSGVTPTQVTVFLGLVGALKLLALTIPVVRGAMVALNIVMAANPIGLVVIAAAALAGAAYLIITNWDQVKETLGNVWESITSWFDNTDWGSLGGKIVDKIAAGMRAALSGIGDAASAVGETIYNFLFTNSPAREGPLNRTSPNQMGESVARNFAGGLSSGSPGVSAAASRIAGSTGAIASPGFAGGPSSSFGSQSFSSGGISGKSGGNFMDGNSGFDQWVKFITDDMTAWNNIFQQAFSLVNSISTIVTSTVRAVANLWDGGDNSLTRPGGLLGPPLPISQQEVPGVQSQPIRGTAPDKWGQDLAAMNGTNGQQSVPGVQGRRQNGAPSNAPPGAPAQTQGQAPAGTVGAVSAPGTLGPDASKQQIADYIINKALAEGYSREQANQILIQAVGESGLDADISGGVQRLPGEAGSDDDHRAIGIFQEKGPFSGGLSVEQRKDPNLNIEAYFRHMREAGGPAAFTDPADFLGRTISGGGPWHPQNQAKGHLDNATSAAQQYIDNYGGPQPATTAGNAGAAPLNIVNRPTEASSARSGSPNQFLVHTQFEKPGATPENQGIPGDAEGLAAWMDSLTSQDEGGRRSYNFLVDPKTGEVVQAVDPNRASWAVGSPGNDSSINAVIAGSNSSWSREQWMEAMPGLRALAQLTAQQAKQFNIPLEQLGPGGPDSAGIGGHNWVSDNLGGTDHTDPGPNFPWQEFMGMVNEAATAPAGLPPAFGGEGGPNQDPFFVDPNATAPGQEGLGDAALPLAGLGGLVGAAALTRAVTAIRTRRAAARGEPILSDLERRLGITPDTPEERGMFSRMRERINTALAAAGEAPLTDTEVRTGGFPEGAQSNLRPEGLPGGDNRGAPGGVDPASAGSRAPTNPFVGDPVMEARFNALSPADQASLRLQVASPGVTPEMVPDYQRLMIERNPLGPLAPQPGEQLGLFPEQQRVPTSVTPEPAPYRPGNAPGQGTIFTDRELGGPRPQPPPGATVPKRPPTAGVGSPAPAAGPAVSPEGLRARIGAIASTGAKILGPMLSFLNGAAISYGIVGSAVDQAEKDLIAQGYSFTTDGTVMGIPVIDSKIMIDSGAVETPYDPNAVRPPSANAGAPFGQQVPGNGAMTSIEGDQLIVRPTDGSPEYTVPNPAGNTTFGYTATPPPRPGINVGLADSSQSTAPDPRREAINASRGSNTETVTPGQGPGWSLNTNSLADIPLSGSTTNSVAAAGIAPLYRNGQIPPEIQEMAKAFGLQVATRTSGDSLHEAGFAFDFTGSPEDMDRFAEFAYTNLRGQTLELIHQNEQTGQRWGVAGAKSVDRPGDKFQNYFTGDDGYANHGDYDDNAHVHWATDVLPARGGVMPPRPDGSQRQPTTPGATDTGGNWMQVPDGWDLNTPIPFEVIQQNMGRGGPMGDKGMTDEELRNLPPMFYAARPGTVSNVPVGPDYQGGRVVSPGGTISVPTTTGAPVAGFPETNDQRTPIDKFSSAMSSAASVAGSAFQVFQDVIASIGATANITKTLVRGFENTEDIVNVIQNFQQYIKTGASIAKLVGDVAGLAGQAGAGDPTGGASAITGAISAVAGIVQAAFEATNAAITLGIDIYHQVGKYAGFYFGGNLGGDNTGPLGGNVRMLLNTRTNQLQTYSEDNPLNKNTFDLSPWQQSYDQAPPAPTIPPTVNIYTGPGQTPRDMMAESMWLISTGGPAVASVAGAE